MTDGIFISIEQAWLGLATYAVAHVIHMIGWRFVPKWRTLKTLVFLMLGAPALIFLVLIAQDPHFISAALIHFVLAANYIAVYPAVQATSPTIDILARLHREGPLTELELQRSSLSNSIVNDRISDLERGGLLKKDSSLSFSGKALARLFISYRKLLNLPQGEG